MISKIHANKELKKEMDLDFEEISDGELEEESRIKGLGDALGVDWASLAKETQRSISRPSDEFYNSTKSRWSAHRILWDVGISVKLAGGDFAREMLTRARDELKREKQEWLAKKLETLSKADTDTLNGDIKKEKLDDVEIKVEPKEDEEVSEQKEDGNMLNDDLEDFELDSDVLLHPIAQVQVLFRKLAIKRRNLILHSSGKYGRALSARSDLRLRRQLCNLPAQDLNVDKSCLTNAELIKNADDVYMKLIGEVN
jgi:zinc finger CCCH domain-containing protein 13